jgi:hypothetical protein
MVRERLETEGGREYGAHDTVDLGRTVLRAVTYPLRRLGALVDRYASRHEDTARGDLAWIVGGLIPFNRPSPFEQSTPPGIADGRLVSEPAPLASDGREPGLGIR